jgi:hypothetical protein
MKPEELELLVNRIVAMGKVLYGLHVVSLHTYSTHVKMCVFDGKSSSIV